MKILRTPDDCFDGINDFSYSPNYFMVQDDELGELRLHYVDEGPADGPVVLCMHGEPSWAYLYRKMIPVFVAAGYRVLAPDLIGLGRSDKPAEASAYTYAAHVRWVRQWVEGMNLQNATFIGQDWGGLIGLRVLTETPDRFSAFSISNTGLPVPHEGSQIPPAFAMWLKFSQNDPEFDIGMICNNFGQGPLSKSEMDAYRAPFPSDDYKVCARVFPTLVPLTADNPAVADNIEAWKVLSAWEKPVLLAFSDKDPITAGGDRPFREKVPGAQGQPHLTLNGGHFIQHEDGERWAQAVIDWLAD
ncbi:MAG: haloalkane dehalogenase [Halioglobus sp.]